ncbi:uncharacterized protein [Takifugu rubripes]|uniref:uncharacterized protein n=1 Tax=Takifugu rubripes TaxID=31033 RepID=UPI001145A4D8|nr:uncharacterized protein LOC101068331 [Takifugu rubripes]
MEAPPLWLLLLLNSLMFMSAQVDVVVEPSTSQFFKYNRFSVSCGADEQEQEVTGWTVMKRTKDGEVRPCPASCVIIGAFPATDSGAYWCESGAGETSQTVNITVTAGSVVLDSPVHPVTEGQDVILTCKCNDRDSTCGLASTFYKDGVMAGSGVGRVLTLHNVSVCDEGFYACEIIGSGKSPESWLTVQGLPPAGRDPPALPDLLLLYHLLVGMPFLVCTLMVGLLYRDRAWRPGVPAS